MTPNQLAVVQRDSMVVTLTKLRTGLSKANSPQEFKRVADISAASEVYAKRQGLAQDIVNDAHSLNIMALAGLGASLKATEAQRNVGGRPITGADLVPVIDTPTLSDLGIDKKTSSLAQKLSDLPETVIESIANRETTLTKALRAKKAAEIRKQVEAPTAKYRVIYADPPWSYGNNQPDYHTEQRDHYPVMPIKDICGMPVADWCEPNAVLFLWVTSPILEESFAVIKAWGFKYKTSFVWDKVKHNMGHYNSVRHELLLICTRGSCVPDVQKLFDSVVTQERTKHSAKPEIFYTIMETIYTHGKRLEIFARNTRDGWDAYGHESDSTRAA